MHGFNLKEALAARHSTNLYRSRKTLETPQGPEITVDGRQYLAFCSNDYLGLANHPKVVASMKHAAEQYGVGGGASHLVIGHSRLHHQLEEELGTLTGRERVLLFSCGYMANLGVIIALLNKQDAYINNLEQLFDKMWKTHVSGADPQLIKVD